MHVFLKQIHDALNKDSSSETIAFYTNFSKAFDKVPHLERLKKLSPTTVGGCVLDVIFDFLDQRIQFVCVVIKRLQLLDVTSGVSQGSVVGPDMFCIFMYDPPAALNFSDTHLFARICPKK